MPHQPTIVRGRIKLTQFATDYCAGRNKQSTRRATLRAAKRIARLQRVFHADSSRALLLVFQGMDASGKDGTIRRVLRFVSPAGVQAAYFKEPTPDEQAHDFLWRVHRAVPPRGIIGVFNRSHYEAVLAERILGHLSAAEVRRRLREITDFERMLADNGVVVVKFFLHLGRAEQAERFRERLHQPHKQWKFRLGDLDTRRHWTSYLAAYEDLLNATSRRYARWHIIPADRKWYRDYLVARTVLAMLESLHLKWPKLKQDLAKIRVK